MNTKVLIVTASTGQGHNAVAAALKYEFECQGYENVCIIEPIKEKSQNLGKMVDGGYKVLATKIPFVYSGLYKMSNKERLDTTMNKMLFDIMDKTLLEIINDYEPALIVSTHPLLVKPISDLIEDGLVHCKFISVVTDFQAHQTYVCSHVNAYIVGSQQTKKGLMEKGIDGTIIYVYGIPIRKDFCNVTGAMNKSPYFTVLIMGGSMGVRGIKKAFKNILEMDLKIKIIVVCGANDDLKETLEEIKKQYDGENEVDIFGYTNRVNELMAISDVIVTKPGGLTVTEALSMKLPMIIPYYIPGQEEENTQIMTDEGVAVDADMKEIDSVLTAMIHKPSMLQLMRDEMERIISSYSVADTIQLAISLIETFNEEQETIKSHADRKEIYILTAAYGNGHLSVAKSITQSLYKEAPMFNIITLDFFKIMAPTKYRGMYGNYRSLIHYAKPMFNMYYYAKEKIPLVKYADTGDISIRKNFMEFMEVNHPSAIISTFSVCSGYVSYYKEKTGDTIPLITVITDIVATNEWIYPHTDLYCVATSRIKDKLQEKGVPSDKIAVTGIPIRDVFYKNTNEKEEDFLSEIKDNKRLITFLGGGLGLLPEKEKLYEWMSQLEDVHILIITGNNRKLYQKFKKELNKENITVIGYVDNMEQVMKRSEILVGKPGGITIFEALMCNVPFVMLKPGLGQEIENSKYLMENEFGFVVRTDRQLKIVIENLLSNEDAKRNFYNKVQEMKQDVDPKQLVSRIIETVGDGVL